ncbi:hypothetical protein [Nannocystis pusilla]|uniref:hypothetical protein n=1 Tax=Nannocystis pusilla TaxID=889268 RepID=UPI003B820023
MTARSTRSCTSSGARWWKATPSRWRRCTRPRLRAGGLRAQAVARREEIERFFAGARAQYLERGVTMTRPEVESREWVGDRVVLVRVAWPYIDRDGREVGLERSTYALRRDDSGALRIRVVMPHRD